MNDLIIRKNSMFVIDHAKLKKKARKTPTINSLYGAVYEEFNGAAKNPNYRDMSLKERMEAVNNFAHNWLKERGLA
jgi:hypothetical protein